MMSKSANSIFGIRGPTPDPSQVASSPTPLLIEPLEKFSLVLHGHAVEDARFDELLQVHAVQRVLAQWVVACLGGGPFPGQTYLVRRPKVLDACRKQAVQRAGLVGAEEKRVSLDDPVDSVICVVFSRSSSVLLSIPLAAPHAREVGQHRKKKPTDR
jgi:hypothetical protein